MLKTLIASAIATTLSVAPALAQYTQCESPSGDIYDTFTLYEYGEGPVLFDDDYEGYDSFVVLSYDQRATMNSEGAHFSIYNGDNIRIVGKMLMADCSLQLLIWHYYLQEAGMVSADVIAIP